MKYLKTQNINNRIKIISEGDWNLYNQIEIEKELKSIKIDGDIVWDFSNINSFDSVGVLLFIQFYDKFKVDNNIEVVGYSDEQKKLYGLIKDNYTTQNRKKREDNLFYYIGKSTMEYYSTFTSYLSFSAHTLLAFLGYFISPRNIRYKEILYHIERSGMNALLIVALTTFLVGLVISYQSAVELAKFGADIFIVDMASISITRELAPMITAIVVAGRSGSAYTAQIGAMNITEEILAMKSMGFNPYYFLVLPRVIALIISLPLLIFFADIMGIMGSMFASNMILDISYTQFIIRVQEVLDIRHFWIGILKGFIFAILISMIGAFRGMQVTQDTESIGTQTTASVVNSIFFVIAFDAIISVILTEWGI
ncbi:Putative ABC transport system permease protein [hydrothermal vent metagenome]|uniref:Putative ABC transport system permease protein n=1 Tax=hydrothermal vent metagenome TaxID=652676 RepID=A0A1W1EJK7_9ZZZZ